MKKYRFITFSAIMCCLLLSGCEKNEKSAPYESNIPSEIYIPSENSSESFSDNKTTPTTNSQSSLTGTNENSTVSEPPSQKPVSTTTKPQSNPTPPESASQTESDNTEAAPTEVDTPQWNETAFNGELYVNTDNIYSRVSAIQGSETVKRFKLNDRVTVTAKTDVGSGSGRTVVVCGVGLPFISDPGIGIRGLGKY